MEDVGTAWPAPGEHLPLCSHGILRNQRIGGEQQAVMLNGLTNQHPVERVPMQRGKLMEVKHGPFIEWERGDPMSLTLIHEKTFDGTGQR